MGKFKAFITGMAVAMVAGSGFAQALDPARMELFRTILQGNDCALTEAEANIIFPQFDFSKSETREIVGVMIASGEVQLDGSTLNLTDGSCGGVDAGVDVAELLGRRDVQQFIAIMAENSCAMTEAEGEAAFTARGIGKAQVSAVVGPMIEAGMASFDSAQGVLSVDAAYCSPVMADSGANEAGASPASPSEPADPVTQVIAVFASQDCRIPVVAANAIFTEAGMGLEAAMSAVGSLMASGQLSMAEGGEMIANASICSPAVALAPAASPEAPAVAPTAAPAMEMTMTMENDGSPEGMLLSYIVQQGCSIEAGAGNLLAESGVRQDQAFRIVDQWVESGKANLTDGGSRVQLDPGLCAAGDAVVVVEPVNPASPPEADTAVADDPRAGLLAMLAQNNCEISLGNAAEAIGNAGLDYNASMGMLSRMMASGEASSPDGGQTLQVSAPLCQPAVAAVPSTPREVFIELLKQNNCRITAAEFSTLLPVNGLDASAAFAMISELEAEGVISLPATRDVVTLSAEMCR